MYVLPGSDIKPEGLKLCSNYIILKLYLHCF